MRLKKIAGVVCCLSLLLAGIPAQAKDSSDVASMVSTIGKDAARGYLQPLSTVLGAGMNSGWYNSAKPLAMFGKLPVGIAVGMVNVPVVVIDNSMKTFNFNGDLPLTPILNSAFSSQGISVNDINNSFSNLNSVEKAYILAQTGYNVDSLGIESLIHFSKANQPTIFGSDTAQTVGIESFLSDSNGTESKTLKTIKAYNALIKYENENGGHQDTIDLSGNITLPFRGLGKLIDKLGGIMFSMPSISIEAGVSKIPVIGNLTLGLRMMPETDLHSISSDIPFGKVSMFGYKVQYEYLHLIPGAGLLPIKSSVMFARSSMDLKTDTVSIKQSSWITQVIASADWHFAVFGAGIYGGIGYQGSNLDLGVKMSKFDPKLEDFTLSIPGKGGFRGTIGPRLSIGFFEVYGDVNFGSITSYNLGVTVCGLAGRGF